MIPKNPMLQKNKIYAILFLALISIKNITSSLTLSVDLFDNHIFTMSFQIPESIDVLKQNYYNLALVSKAYSETTKNFWNQNWFSIMEHVCAQNRYSRLYFATIFYYSNNEIKNYFINHVTIYQRLFYRSANENYVSPPAIKWLDPLDPAFTSFGKNCQISLLEMLIKSHFYPIKNKVELCIELVKKGAPYDIWIYEGWKTPEPLDKVMFSKKPDIAEKLKGSCLLSEFIAMHFRCSDELAEIIMKKGTVAQELFILRFPKLEAYRKDNLHDPHYPDDFKNKNHFSAFRLKSLMLNNIFTYKNSHQNYKKEHYRDDGINYCWLAPTLDDNDELCTLYNHKLKDSDGRTMDSYIERTFFTQSKIIHDTLVDEKKKIIEKLHQIKEKNLFEEKFSMKKHFFTLCEKVIPESITKKPISHQLIHEKQEMPKKLNQIKKDKPCEPCDTDCKEDNDENIDNKIEKTFFTESLESIDKKKKPIQKKEEVRSKKVDTKVKDKKENSTKKTCSYLYAAIAFLSKKLKTVSSTLKALFFCIRKLLNL